MKRKAIVLVLVASLLFGAGVPISNQTVVVSAAKKVKISEKKLTLTVGAKKRLKVTGTKKKVTWSSNKKKIATVSKTGVVSAKKKGTAVITAKVGKKKYKCKVTVNNKISLSAKSLTLEVGSKKTLKLKNTKKKVTWSSDNRRVATVSKLGVVTAVSQGKATIIAKSAGKKYKCTVTVQTKSSTTSSNNSTADNNSNNNSNNNNNNTNNSTENDSDSGNSGNTTDTPVAPVTEDVLTFSKESGTYSSAFDLTISSSNDAKIYYTTDGSDPRTSKTRKEYKAGISIKSRKTDENVLSAKSPDEFDTMNYAISGDTLTSICEVPDKSAVDKCSVIKAASSDAEGNWSAVSTNTYFIGAMSEHIEGIKNSVQAANNNLSVISISINKDDLFDYEKGIYVKGKYFDESLKKVYDAGKTLWDISNEGTMESELSGNFLQKGRDWERNCHIDYFESDGTNTECLLQQDCGIRIQGNYSRRNVQKSFRLYAREDYGEKNFKYEFFGDNVKDASGKNLKKFKTLVLRNGGNDAFNYKYKDILTQSFMNGSNCVTLTGRPCVVYLNGEYWGYYVLQDDVTDNFLEEHLGVEKDDVIAYKASDEAKYADYKYKLDIGDFPDGVTNEDYYLIDTLQYLDDNDFSNDSVYQEFCNTYMDESSAVDYFASMIYLNNGYDWPNKNWSIWKTTKLNDENAYSDGKWRFLIADLDLTTVPTWSEYHSTEWQANNIPKIAVKNSDNVMQKFFGNLIENSTFRQKLIARIQTIGSENYEANLVAERGAQYEGMYGSLSPQFQKRFNSNGAVYSIGEKNHDANMDFLSKRNSYVPNIVSYIQNNYKTDKVESVDGVLAWNGSWTRYGTSNVTTSETEGLTTERDDTSYIKLTVADWSKLTNPVIKLSVADGAAAGARCHIWDENKSSMDTYYTESETAWIGQEISIEALRGKDIYVNANDATLTKIEIYSK